MNGRIKKSTAVMQLIPTEVTLAERNAMSHQKTNQQGKYSFHHAWLNKGLK